MSRGAKSVWVIVCLAIPALTGKGCGGGTAEDVGDGGGSGGGTSGACLPSRGPDGKTGIVAEGTTIVATVDRPAQTLWMVAGRLFAKAPFHGLATGSCGKAGVLWRSGEGRLRFRELAPEVGSDEVVLESVPDGSVWASLFFDRQCEPVALVPESEGWAQFVREPAGTWVRTPPPTALEGGLSGLVPMAAWTDRDGGMHLLGTARIGGADVRGLHGRRSAEPGSSWTWETFDLPRPDGIAAMRVGTDGTLHALYTRTETPCDPCNLNLYYGRKAPGGAWIEEVVQESRWGDPDDAFLVDPAMVLGPDGEPIVAAAWQQRVVTGSLESSELRLYGRKDGKWCFETVAVEVDGYRGGDGSRMTGAFPSLELDEAGRVHVVFQDLAQWHDGNGWSNGAPGQVRYAVRSGKTWTIRTLLRQKGQSEQARPLEGVAFSQVAVMPDGSRAFVAAEAFTWDTDRIYNEGEPSLTLRATIVEARIGD